METKIAVLIITAVLACLSWKFAEAARGFIATCPKNFEKDAVNEIQLSLFEVNAKGIVTVALSKSEENQEDSIIAQTTVNVEPGENIKLIKLPVSGNNISEYEAKVWINGTFATDDNYAIYDEDTVYFHSLNSDIIFIQTDKPIYKPGQKMMFRTLAVDRYLRPLGEDTLGEIWVEDPSGSRIVQWKNVSLGNIRHFESPLSDEPVLGMWQIFVDIGKQKELTRFEVREYVLPKFEVVITPPPYVLADRETFPIEICAKYTYGKPVEGIICMNMSLESYSWSNDKFPVLEKEDKFEGCYTYDLNVSLIDENLSHTYRRIQVSVQVAENGTGIKRNNTAYIERTQNPLKLNFDTSQYFKPGLPAFGKVKVTSPDDTPAPEEDIQVCNTISRERVLHRWWATRKVKCCRNYTSDASGIVSFVIPPQSADTVSMSLEAKSIKYGTSSTSGKPFMYQPQTSSYFQPWYSPSKSHLQVQGSNANLKCGEQQTIKILFTAKDGEKYNFHYWGISKGKVVLNSSEEVTFTAADDITDSICNSNLAVNSVEIPLVPPESKDDESSPTAGDAPCEKRQEGSYIGSTEFTLDVSSAFSPAFQLLVYYNREDGEVVADSLKFTVDKCFQNKVNFEFGDAEVQPGAKTTVTVRASPKSLCGIKVVDKSISLLDSNDQLTKDKVFEALQKFDSGSHYARNHCNTVKRKGGRSKIAQSEGIYRPWSSSRYSDTVTAFENTGLTVFSDLTLLTRPCKSNSNSYETYGGIAMASIGVRGGASGDVAAMPPAAFSASTNARRKPVNEVASSKLASTATKSFVEVRNFFPETWLFETVAVGESGEMMKKETLPHTITEWVGSAVCLNPVDGLGVSDVSRIRGFQAFFLSFTLPYSVIRGEKVPVLATMFNYLDDCLPIAVSMKDWDLAGGHVNGNEVVEKDYCVCGGKSVTHTFFITPTIVGSMNITVSARTAENQDVCADETVANVVARDSATVQLLVEAEGFPQEKVNSILFCPEENENSLFKEVVHLDLPEDLVSDSERAYFTVTGDIMGPTIDGLDNLVQLPTGCGEQNMVRFTPNIAVLDYLTSARKLTNAIQQKALKNLKIGYQRELKYRHPDGSYSAFGPTDRSGSTWLSAFVLKSFAQARRFITIDDVDIEQTRAWIASKQGPDGCFQEVGRVLQEGMKGGVSSSETALTAYTLIALLSAGYENSTMIESALSCLEKQDDLTPYGAALSAYAAALANSSKADVYLEELMKKALVSGDKTYWKNINGSSSLDIETASYGILALLKRKGDDSLVQVLSIVRWMTGKRNSNGGFVSTQDTIVGLEAISNFASIISQDPVSLTVTFKGNDVEKTISITEDDKTLVKKEKISKLPVVLEVEATGTGCGLIQTSLRYNTVNAPKKSFFSIKVEGRRSEECKRGNISVCVSYLPDNQNSNMALVEVKLPSGFVALKDSLEKLINNAKVQLKRYEINNNNVVLYFDELSNDSKCFSFDVEDAMGVENTKAATAKVYDYYSTDKKESTDYTMPNSCLAA